MTREARHIPLFNLQRQYQPLKAEILEKWSKIIAQNELTFGAETAQFETDFCKVAGSQFAIGVRSGTASLFIALLALGLKPGDEVITTPNTFSATADAISLIGATPVFVDVEPSFGNIDPTLIPFKVTAKTKAVLVVHLHGVPCQMDELRAVCKAHHLYLVEDASHAHGSLYKGKPVGSFGVVGCFSLYPSKTLGAAGNAGVITTSDKAVATKARMFAHHGIKEGQSKYIHHLISYNELIDNVQAAVLNVKLPLLNKWIHQKMRIAERYNQAFQERGQKGMLWPEHTQPAIYVYSIQLPDRQKFQTFMKGQGIETGIYYPTPLHLQPSYAFLGYKQGDFPHAEKWMSQTISLPLYPELTAEEAEYVVDAIRKAPLS